MTAVFSHGRLRLYLLKLLAEGPKHGYELIRLLENRFLGLYAPSAGTIYPRLQRMEVEGLVTHTAAGGRKIYEITDAGREELRQRSGELTTLEAEIHASVADLSSLAKEIQNEVRGSVRDIKRELREQARQARSRRFEPRASWEQARWEFGGRAPETEAPPGGSASGAPGTSAAPGGSASGAPGTSAAPGGSASGGSASGAPVRTVLERQAGELAAEVRRLARRPGVREETLRAAAAAIEAALAVLRRLP